MIPPRKDPPAWRTAHGATASPRMARLYWFLRDNGIAVSDWATDQNVEQEIGKLETLLNWLKGAMLAEALGELAELRGPAILITLREDLENVMRRRPSARVPS